MIHFKKDGSIFRHKYGKDDKTAPVKIETSLVPYLTEAIELEEGLTFDTFMQHVFYWTNTYDEVFASHLGGYPLSSWLQEFEMDAVEKDDVKYLEVSHASIQINASGPSDFNINDIDIYDDFHGWGSWGKMDGVDQGDGCVGIEYSPLYELKNYALKLKKEVIVSDASTYKEICKMERYFSVYDVIGTILYEISWAGAPIQRDNQFKEIVGRVDESMEDIKKGNMEKFSTPEEMLDKLHERIKDAKEKGTFGPSCSKA